METGRAEDERRERRRGRRRGFGGLLVVGGLLALGLLLIGWHRVATSDAFCSSCHEMQGATASSERSVHAGLPCLACHTGPGLAGSLRYVPGLAREAVATATPWNAAHGILAARSCTSCHTDLARTPELAAAHDTGSSCASCHGDVSHPPFRLAGFARPTQPVQGESPHPRLYVQAHGGDAVADAASCASCHGSDFCETCHLRETYPHPRNWIALHGPAEREQGIGACEGCHPQTFCAGCHGTEIPHDARWLGEHWRELQDAGARSCLLCHPRSDCTTCHAEHQVHREQDLYAR